MRLAELFSKDVSKNQFKSYRTSCTSICVHILPFARLLCHLLPFVRLHGYRMGMGVSTETEKIYTTYTL